MQPKKPGPGYGLKIRTIIMQRFTMLSKSEMKAVLGGVKPKLAKAYK